VAHPLTAVDDGPFLAAAVRGAAHRFPDRPAICSWDGWALTYADLERLSDEVAAGFTARGVGDGDIVALVLPSTPDYLVAYAAAAKVGAATAGVNPRLSPPERAGAVELADPALVVATDELAVGLAAGERRGPHVEVVAPGSSRETVLAGLRVPGGSPPRVAADPDRTAALVFTSGTTGAPKAAVFTERELAAVTAADWGDRWDGGGPMLVSTQFAHVGVTTKLPWYLRSGATLHLVERWRTSEVLGLVERERIRSLGGVAPQLAVLLADPAFDSYDTSSVTTIIMGGAASPPALVREARERFGAAYSIRYSSTESGGVGTGTAFDADDEEALLTVGRPRPGVELRVCDEEGHDVAPGEVGEVWLRTPTGFRGYWRDPAATEATLRDGWIVTGDLGRVDDRGCLRLAGRAKEMYIRGGYNVHPAEVEAVLSTHPAVREVAVVARHHPVLGEIGVAVVAVRGGDPAPSLDDLRAHAAPSLARYKLPEAAEVVDELPRTAMQKIDRRALAERFGPDDGRPGGEAGSR
jgi:acyl-CoA synthetase (AMP-forming)/AMP-acid ligase II